MTMGVYEEKNFEKRTEAIDFIGFQVIDRIGDLLRNAAQADELIQLRSRAEELRSELEEIDSKLFQKLQAKILVGECTGKQFKAMIGEYVDPDPGDPGLYSDHDGCREETGYDNLDVFINGLTLFSAMPEQTRDLEPGMVYYQKTPARIVFELIERLQFMEEDVFFDLGSGLGQVAILVNLLTGIRARGVEFEPGFCDYARECAAALNLSHVTFINVDARKADFSEGTVFFMFTPFRGEILQEVLGILKKESLQRKIKIITYGPCTTQVASESWLDPAGPGTGDGKGYNLGFFISC